MTKCDKNKLNFLNLNVIIFVALLEKIKWDRRHYLTYNQPRPIMRLAVCRTLTNCYLGGYLL